MDKYMLIVEYAQKIIAPPAEVIVIATALIVYMLFIQSYIYKNKSLSIIMEIVRILFVASLVRLTQYMVMVKLPQMHLLIYTLRGLYYICVCLCYYLEASYLRVPLRFRNSSLFTDITAVVMLIAAVICDGIFILTRVGFHMVGYRAYDIAGNPFVVYCITLCIFICVNIIHASARITRKTAVGLLVSFIVPLFMLFFQNFFDNKHYMTFCTFIPVFALILLFHTGAYNKLSSTAGANVFYNQLDHFLEKDKTCFIYMGYIRNFSNLMKHSKEFSAAYENFFHASVRDGMIFLLDNSRVVMLFEKKNRNFEDVERDIEKSFYESFGHLKLDYKVLSLETSPKITNGREYGKLLSYVEERLENCSAYRLTEDDFNDFLKSEFIYEELCDIHAKKNIDDPRVLVYCQPVYNVNTGTYDTAEALMRLKIHKYGLIYPDQFIPMAEKHDMIHTLTLIMINKVSKRVSYMLRNGYHISRISVNFSIGDMEQESLAREITEIIQKNGLGLDKIAAEITESKVIKSFENIKPHILYFHERGMKLYLDDFGTGYSNFDRIMELPFDIIKFDRSLVIEARKNQKNHFMVKTFAQMFMALEYNILYEGIEDIHDEQSCVNMGAAYLQGYKYSKPVPIEDWIKFLTPQRTA